MCCPPHVPDFLHVPTTYVSYGGWKLESSRQRPSEIWGMPTGVPPQTNQSRCCRNVAGHGRREWRPSRFRLPRRVARTMHHAHTHAGPRHVRRSKWNQENRPRLVVCYVTAPFSLHVPPETLRGTGRGCCGTHLCPARRSHLHPRRNRGTAGQRRCA